MRSAGTNAGSVLQGGGETMEIASGNSAFNTKAEMNARMCTILLDPALTGELRRAGGDEVELQRHAES